jgi:hypothetical protein
VLDPFFIWLESTSFSVWMRESPSLFAFPLILAAHTIGLGLLAGVDVAHDLRILGAAPKIPIEFDRYLRIMWFGLAVNAASGVALLIGYPTKALTNPVFYLKLGLIAVALVLVNVIRRRQQSYAQVARHDLALVLGRCHCCRASARVHVYAPRCNFINPL